MTRLIFGDRIGRLGTLAVGCTALLFDSAREKTLLTKRADTMQWCLPGGLAMPGESVSEACVREVLEETGLQTAVTRLLGVYSTPHRLVEYRPGALCQMVTLSFEVALVDGQLTFGDEVVDSAYFSLKELGFLNVMDNHLDQIVDGFSSQLTAHIR